MTRANLYLTSSIDFSDSTNLKFFFLENWKCANMACSCLPVSPFTHGHATKRPLSDSSNFIGPFGIEHTPRCHELSTDAHIYRISMWKLTGDEEQNTQPIDGVHFGRRCERVSERMQTGEAVWIWTSFMSQMTSTVCWFTHFSNETLTTKEVTKIIWKK